ncbi:glycoside hydrolase family 32 protein [Spongiivirga citrea]|uniref:Glycoside hydrolase family 32 protein n=1 Tax=Spongiivirga citrea TaxID=1481457 RepID=A0A6M0CRJ6_9FLAO|nr:glycoside hydrolase family 32 protein [Spongiivirga citrea]NER16530.1 glycoside hydrolase family 32 protein [Spongiivirga citrea]
MKRAFLVSVLFFAVCASCKKKVEKQAVSAQPTKKSYDEPHRNQFHFSPPEKWMNDPNGLVYNEGVYHLYYQYYPEDIVWGPMHWGHATSKDLIQWDHQPIALFPDEHGYIFSGSAVVDHKNSSGFGTAEKPALVAIFTYHLMEGEKAGRNDFQTQGIAYSNDNGQTWTKYEGNPVIKNPTSIRDFRDPKVFWHDESNQWIMALVAGDHAKFYSSPNLKEWTYLSEFGKTVGAHGGVWECPDLFKLKVEGEEEEKWVLLISINPGAPNGGSGTQYFIGDFDGNTFTTNQKDIKWLDYGTDNYAGVTYNNTPDDQRLFIGWMSNWNYAQKTPTKEWRSAMTIPRKLDLIKLKGDYLLKSVPMDALNKYATSMQKFEKENLDSIYTLDISKSTSHKTSFYIDPDKSISIELKNKANEKVVINYNTETSEFQIDRSKSGITDFEESFKDSMRMPVKTNNIRPKIELFVDRSSIELFFDDGNYVMTLQVFPTSPYDEMTFSGQQGQLLDHFEYSTIKSTWNE